MQDGGHMKDAGHILKDAGFNMQDAGHIMQDAGFNVQNAGHTMQDSCRMLDLTFKFNIQDAGHIMLELHVGPTTADLPQTMRAVELDTLSTYVHRTSSMGACHIVQRMLACASENSVAYRAELQTIPPNNGRTQCSSLLQWLL